MMDKCLSTDKCVSAYARSVEQVQQEGQLYPNQQASSRAPMPPTTLVLQGGHAETWKLLPLQLLQQLVIKLHQSYFLSCLKTPKTKQSHMSCITKQSHMSCVLNKNTAAEGRHLDVPKTCAPGCRTTVHETIVPDTGQLQSGMGGARSAMTHVHLSCAPVVGAAPLPSPMLSRRDS